MKVFVDKNKTIMLEGPSEFKIVNGEAEIFGYKVNEEFKGFIETYKAVPIYYAKEGVIEVKGGKVSEVSGSTIPASWNEVLNEILTNNYRKIIIIGDVDSGKSGLVTYLANGLFTNGKKVGIVDADTGQSDIGPPTTIGLGVVDKNILLTGEVKLYDAVFIGLTSPQGLLHRSVSATTFLTNLALSKLGLNLVIINTTGWIGDRNGRDLKISKVLSLNPDLIIGIEKKRELEHLLKFFEKIYKVKRVGSPQVLRARTREERAVIRTNAYKRYFKEAKVKDVDLEKFATCYSFLGTGEKIKENEFLEIKKITGKEIPYAEKSNDALVLFSKDLNSLTVKNLKDKFNVREVLLLSEENIKNLLISFGSKEKMFLGLGIIVNFDLMSLKLKVLTNADINKASFIQFGCIKINPETFMELGWVDKWSF